MNRQTAEFTIMPAHSKSFLFSRFAKTVLACEIWRNFYQSLISFYRFITQHSEEITPTRIVYLLTQDTSRHSENVQLFNNYRVEITKARRWRRPKFPAFAPDFDAILIRRIRASETMR